MPLSEDLAATVTGYISTWKRMSRAYAGMSIVLRLALIISSAILASKLAGINWKDSDGGAWLSALVGIGTAVDSWLKPRDKWKGFMTVCERAEDLLMRLRNTNPAEASKVDQLREEFQRILETHREKNVY
jgi:hypothetical protein